MFSADKLEKLPDQSELYFWADYVELRCLTDPDGQFSLDRLTQHLNFADDLAESSPEAQDPDESDVQDLIAELVLGEPDPDDEMLLPAETSEDDVESGLPGVDYSDYGRASEVRDRRRRWSEDVFRLIASRAALMGEVYPFRVADDSFAIERLENTSERLAYVYYLVCSSLRCVDGTTQSKLTSSFEVVSADVLRLILPEPAVVDVFGTARGLATSMFTGSLYDRIVALTDELRGKVVVEEVDFHPKDSADNGLDLVAWIPLGDEQPGVPSFFAQCACGTNWMAKQSEASYLQRWHRFISLVSPAVTLTFIPHFFRKAGAHWSADSDVETVLIDRLRALRAYAAKAEECQSIPFDLIQSAWDFRLDTV